MLMNDKSCLHIIAYLTKSVHNEYKIGGLYLITSSNFLLDIRDSGLGKVLIL